MTFLAFWIGWGMGLGTGLYWAWLARQIRDDEREATRPTPPGAST